MAGGGESWRESPACPDHPREMHGRRGSFPGVPSVPSPAPGAGVHSEGPRPECLRSSENFSIYDLQPDKRPLAGRARPEPGSAGRRGGAPGLQTPPRCFSSEQDPQLGTQGSPRGERRCACAGYSPCSLCADLGTARARPAAP